MAIDFTRVLKTMDGATLTELAQLGDGKPPESVNATLGRIACNALVNSNQGERALPGDEQVKRFFLAQKVLGNAAAELSADEIVLIKDRIAKTYDKALVVGQAWEMLDPEGTAAERAKTDKKKKAA